MQILVVEPGKSPVITEIDGNLKEMEKIVGGTIQAVYPFLEDVALICHDEGKILGLPLNRGLRDEHGNLYDIICGTFFLCDAPSDSERFTSLPPEQFSIFQRRLQTPEMFLTVDGQIVCFPTES